MKIITKASNKMQGDQEHPTGVMCLSKESENFLDKLYQQSEAFSRFHRFILSTYLHILMQSRC